MVTGFVSPTDLPTYYALMDIFVQPSLRDGLPNALLEAMACEKAVIGSVVGGIVDAITDGENGKLVSTNNADELADTINELLTDGNLQMKLGTEACQTIKKKFTLQAELDANLDIYRHVGLKM